MPYLGLLRELLELFFVKLFLAVNFKFLAANDFDQLERAVSLASR